MRDVGFTDIETLECLQRVHDVRPVSVPVANLGYGSANSDCSLHTKSKLSSTPVTGHIETVKSIHHHQNLKKAKHSTEAADNENDITYVDDDKDDEPVAKVSSESRVKAENMEFRKQPCTKALYNFKSALPVSQMTGHTGYLTFATLYPK